MSQIIRFEKIVPEGKAMGHLPDGRAVFAIGPLPGEVAEIGIRKHKKTYAEAELRKIVEPSKKRLREISDHAMSTSPWQGVDYDYQIELKHDMLADAFMQQHLALPDFEMRASPEQLGYRNRLDFTVATIDGELRLAFHRRGSWDSLLAIDGSNLGTDRMNAAARNLVDQLNADGIAVEPAMITVRHARTTNQLLTILTTSAKADWKRIDAKLLDNFVVARPLSGSGGPGGVVFTKGNTYITEELGEVSIAYPYNGFFQTNTPLFEQALEQIIAAAKDHDSIVELYSGVGAIGLPLAASGAHVRGVEIVMEAVEFAERNARANHIATYSSEAVAAEMMDASVLQSADCIIVDPPRAGLHPRVTRWIQEAGPKTLIYLSCNPITQARDIAALTDYALDSITGYDFYPGTLHLESLAILKRR